MLNRKLFYPACGPMPYESIYSIYLKISHANYIKFSSLGRALGIVSQQQWALHKLSKWLECNVDGIYEHLPWSYAPSSCLKLLPDGKFRFCKECVSFGYQSVFNNIISHRICAMHKLPLTEACALCAKKHLAGFHDCSSIFQPAIRCAACGFQDIGILSEIKMRHSPGLIETIKEYGSRQAEWYSALGALGWSVRDYCNFYLVDDVYRDYLTGPLEQLTGLDSPETLSGSTKDKQPIVFLRSRLKSSSLIGSRVEPQSVVCNKLLHRHLAGHQSCLSHLSQMVDYPNGKEMETCLCPVSLAYILLCTKDIYSIQASSGSASARIEGLEKLELPLRPPEQVFSYRDAVLVFLSILGKLEYYVSKGQSFYVLSRPEHKYLFQNETSGVILKKSSYSFRNLCRSKPPRIRVFRDGIGGPILIISDLKERPNRDYRATKRVIF